VCFNVILALLKTKIRKRHIILLATLITVSLLIIGVSLTQKNGVVSEKELENYVVAYLRKYKEVVEDNLHLVHDIENIFFKYNNNPRVVYGVISKDHGAAIVLKYEATEKVFWNIKVIDKPLEFYFWPNMSSDLNNLKIVKIASSDSPYVLNSQISIKNFCVAISERRSLALLRR
jgi:hypothetical protein